VKAEAYAMLEIVTDVVEHLEDAGDEMNTAFGAYQLGRRSYNGGGSIGRLVQAVINFLNPFATLFITTTVGAKACSSSCISAMNQGMSSF
jgi:hypothetical protein